jgi:Cytochrome P450
VAAAAVSDYIPVTVLRRKARRTHVVREPPAGVSGLAYPPTRGGENKEEIARPLIEAAERDGGDGRVVLIGIAQEKTPLWRSWKAKGQEHAAHPHMEWGRQMGFVNHFYFYLWDPDWGGAFWKTNAYAPWPVWIWLNGHTWAQRQCERLGIGYTALDNGFRDCEDPAALQRICDRLGSGAVKSFRLFLARIQATEPDHAQQAIEDARQFLFHQLEEDAALYRNAQRVLDGFSRTHPLEGFRYWSVRGLARDRIKMREDLDAFAKSRRNQIADWSDSRPPSDETYLDAVIAEAMRVRPPLPITARAVERDCVINDLAVPAGTIVLLYINAIHKRADLYPDPHRFDPERFAGRHPDTRHWMPFGGGAHYCLGAQLSLLESRVLVRTILERHRFAPDHSPDGRQVQHRSLMTLPGNGARVTLLRRD